MMKDMISKDKLLESLSGLHFKTPHTNRTQVPITEIYVSFIDVNKAILQQPTIEAIPVEQVARMLDKASHCPPCIALSMPGIDDIDKWCDENCQSYIETDKRDCWLHALQEGWLDE